MVDIYFCHTDGNADVSPRIYLRSDGPGEISFLDMLFVCWYFMQRPHVFGIVYVGSLSCTLYNYHVLC